MNITKEEVTAERASLVEQLGQLDQQIAQQNANRFAFQGAILLCDRLLAKIEKPNEVPTQT